MAGAGKLPFGVFVSTLFILLFAAVSSERACGLDEYSIECEETNATLLSTCEAKLTQKEAQIARIEAELAQIQNQLAEKSAKMALTQDQMSQKESDLAEMSAELALTRDKLAETSAELALTREQLAQSRTKPALKVSELAEKVAEWATNHTYPEETSRKPPIPEADAKLFSVEYNSSQIDLRSILTELAENNARLLMESRGVQSRVLSTALLSIMNMTTVPAAVPNPKIYETLNQTATFSCGSDGRPLSLCLYYRTVSRGKKEVIWMNRHGGNVTTDGIRLSSPVDLDGGKCSVSIGAVTKDNFGAWTCILVAAADGEVLTGDVELRDAPETSIFLPTSKKGIWGFSVKTSQVTRMWDSDEYIVGIAFDAARNISYWNSGHTIYRAKINETETETLLNITGVRKYGSIYGLAYDWIADNLYVATAYGFVLACNYNATFRCATLLDLVGPLQGIALDPNEGTLYISRFTGRVLEHCILKGGTDGSSLTGIVAGARAAHGIQIDFHSGRLYWAELYDGRIRSSNLDGGDVVTVHGNSKPYGISIVGSRIFWSEWLSGELRSMLKSGTEIRTEKSGMYIHGHIVSTDWSLPKNRRNDCASQDCSGLCVLTRTSFKCLE